MFESEPSEYYQEIPYKVNRVFKNKGEVNLQLWVEHFSRPCKERNKSLNTIFETDLINMKRKYVFLEANQIMGKTLSTFGIESVCGEVSRSFLQKFKKRKTKDKTFRRTTQLKNTRLFLPPRNKIFKKTVKKSVRFEKLSIPRYPPVAERWSDTAFRKFKEITDSKDISQDESYTFLNDENLINSSKEVNKSYSSSKAGISTDIYTEQLNRSDINKSKSYIVKNNINSQTDKAKSSPSHYPNDMVFNPKNNKTQLNECKNKSGNNFKTNHSLSSLQAHKVSGHFMDNDKRNSLKNGDTNLNIEENQLATQISHLVSNQTSDNSEFWSTTAVINEPESRNSLVQKEILKESLKKSVRFNDNLCSFAPTPQYLESPTLGNSDILRNTPNTKEIMTLSECEQIFDELLNNTTFIGTNSNIESECNGNTEWLPIETCPEKGSDSSKAAGLSSPTLSFCPHHINDGKECGHTAINDKTSSVLSESQNIIGTIVKKSDIEIIEPIHESDIVVEETSSSSNILESQNNTKDSHKISHRYNKTKPYQNPPARNKVSIVDLQLEKNNKKKTVIQTERALGFDLGKMKSNQKVGSKHSVPFPRSSKNEIVIEDTPSSSEDIGGKTLSGVSGSKINQQFRIQNEQNMNINSTNEESYSNNKDLISVKEWYPEGSDEEYIPLSNCEESIESNSEVDECDKKNKPDVPPDLHKSENKHNTRFQDNNIVRQLITKEENKNTGLLTPAKVIVSHIPQNFSPTGSLSDRDYLSDNSVLSSQYDIKEVSNTVSDKAITEKINKSMNIETEQIQKYNKSSVKTKQFETKNIVDSEQHSEKKELTCKLFNKVDRYDNNCKTQHVEGVSDKYKSISVIASSTISIMDSSLDNKVSVDLSTPQSRKLSKEDISGSETMNVKISDAPSKNSKIMKNSDTLDTPNSSLSKVSNTKLCKTLFSIQVQNENLHSINDAINELKKKDREHPVAVSFESTPETGNISKVISSQSKNTEHCKNAVDPNVSPIVNSYKNNYQGKSSEINLNRYIFKPTSRLSFNEELTNSQCLAESKDKKHNNVNDIGNFSQNVESNVKTNWSNMSNSVSLEEALDNAVNKPLEEYVFESQISEGLLNNRTEHADSKIRGGEVNNSLDNTSKSMLAETRSTQPGQSDRPELNKITNLSKIRHHELNKILDSTQSSQINVGKHVIKNNNFKLTDSKSQLIIEMNSDTILVNPFEDCDIKCATRPLLKPKINDLALVSRCSKVRLQDFDEEYIPLSNCEESFESNSEVGECDKENKPEVLRDMQKSQNKPTLNTCFQAVLQENNIISHLIAKEEKKNTGLLTPTKDKDMVSHIPLNFSPAGSLSDYNYLSNDSKSESIVSSQFRSKQVSNTVSDKAITGKINKSMNIETQQVQKYNKPSVKTNQFETKNRVDRELHSENEKLTCKLVNKVDRYDNNCRTQHVEGVLDNYKCISVIASSTISIVDSSLDNKVSVDLSTPQISKLSQEDVSRREIMNGKISNAPSKNNGIMISSGVLDTPNSSFSKLSSTKLCKTLFPIQVQNENLHSTNDAINELKENECEHPITLSFESIQETRNSSKVIYSPFKRTESYKYEINPNVSPIKNNYKNNNQDKASSVNKWLTNSKCLAESNGIKLYNMKEIENFNINMKSSSKTYCSNSKFTYLQKDNCANMSNLVSVDDVVDNKSKNYLSSESHIVISPIHEGLLNKRIESSGIKFRSEEVTYSLDNTSKSRLEEKGSSQPEVNNVLEFNKLIHLDDDSNEIVDKTQNAQIKLGNRVIKNNNSTLANSKSQFAEEINNSNVCLTSSEDSDIICATRPLQPLPNNDFSLSNNSKLHKINDHGHLEKFINCNDNKFSLVKNVNSGMETTVSVLHSIPILNAQTKIKNQKKREFSKKVLAENQAQADEDNSSMIQHATVNLQEVSLSTEKEILSNSVNGNSQKGSIRVNCNVFEETQTHANIYKTSISASSNSVCSNTSLKKTNKIELFGASDNNARNVNKNTQHPLLNHNSQLDTSSQKEKPNFKRYYSTQNKVKIYHNETEAKINETDIKLTSVFDLKNSPSDKILDNTIIQGQTLSGSEEISETYKREAVGTDTRNQTLMDFPKYNSDIKTTQKEKRTSSCGSNQSQLISFKANSFKDPQSDNMQTVQQNYTFLDQPKQAGSDYVENSVKILFGSSSPCKLGLRKRHGGKSNKEHSPSDEIFNSTITQGQTLSTSEEISDTYTYGTVGTNTGNKILMTFPKYNNEVKTTQKKKKVSSSGSNKSQLISFEANSFKDPQSDNLQSVQQNYTFLDQPKQAGSDYVEKSVKILFGTSSPCKLGLRKRHDSKSKEIPCAYRENSIVKINSDTNFRTIKEKENISEKRNKLMENFNPKYKTRQQTHNSIITYSESSSPVMLTRVRTQNATTNTNGNNTSSYATTLKIPLSKQVRSVYKKVAKFQVPELESKTYQHFDEDGSLSAFEPMSSKPLGSSNKESSSSHENELDKVILNQNETLSLDSLDFKRWRIKLNKQLIDNYSEENYSVSSPVSMKSRDSEADTTPSGNLSCADFRKNLNLNFDLLRSNKEYVSTHGTRKRKQNNHEEISDSDEEVKQKRDKRTLSFPQGIDDSNYSPPQSKSSDSENSLVYESDSHFDNESNLMSDEPEFEDDILNTHAGTQTAVSGSQSSNNIVRHFHHGSDLSSVKTDSEFPSMGSGFVPTSPCDWNRGRNEYLINMFDSDNSSSMRSLSPGQDY